MYISPLEVSIIDVCLDIFFVGFWFFMYKVTKNKTKLSNKTINLISTIMAFIFLGEMFISKYYGHMAFSYFYLFLSCLLFMVLALNVFVQGVSVLYGKKNI